MKLCAIAPEGTSWTDIGHQFADYVYEKSKGRMKISWYLGGAMGDEPSAIKKIRLGQLQGGVFTILGMAKIVPDIRILVLPNLFRNYDEVDYILEKTTPAFSKMFAEKDFVLFGWVEVGFAYFFSKKPIRNLEEIKATKVWNWAGDPLQQEIVEMQGYNAVPLELFHVLVGLQTGIIDTFFAPYYACLALQWYSYAKYVNTSPLAYTPGGMLLDKNFYDRLPKDLRELLWEANKIYIPRLIPMIRSDHTKALDGFIKYGIEPLEPTPDMQKEMDRLAQETYNKLGYKYYPEWLFKEVTNGLAEFRAGKAGK